MRIINFIKSRLRKILLDEVWLEDYIKRGMKIGNNCSIQPGVIFDYSHCWLINIGNNVTIAPQAYILAHDASTKKLFDYTKIGSVVIEDDVFIGARSLIMPGVTIGKGSIIGSNSVVTKSIPSNVVAAGNPAKILCSLDDYKQNNMDLVNCTDQIYDYLYTVNGGINDLQKEKMYNDLIDRIGYVK